MIWNTVDWVMHKLELSWTVCITDVRANRWSLLETYGQQPITNRVVSSMCCSQSGLFGKFWVDERLKKPLSINTSDTTIWSRKIHNVFSDKSIFYRDLRDNWFLTVISVTNLLRNSACILPIRNVMLPSVAWLFCLILEEPRNWTNWTASDANTKLWNMQMCN